MANMASLTMLKAPGGVREALGGWESCNISSRLLLARQSRADIA